MNITATHLDHTFSALSDPTRRAILDDLRSGEKSVSEIAKPYDMSLNGISKHILKLERAGLVKRRRAGRTHFLAANPNALIEAAEWLDNQRALWARRLDRLETLIELEDKHD